MAHATATRSLQSAFLGRWQQENAASLEEARRALYRFVQNRLSLVGLGLILALVVVALTGPLWAPYPADATGAIHAADRFLSPQPGHLFGTDELGRDVFRRGGLAPRLALLAGRDCLDAALSS